MGYAQKLGNKRNRRARNKSLSPRYVVAALRKCCEEPRGANYGEENSNIWIRHLVQNHFHAIMSINVPKNDACRFWCTRTGLAAGHERASSGSFSKNAKNVKDFRAVCRCTK